MNAIRICENNELNYVLKSFLNSALKEAMAVVDAESGSLFLFDSEKRELVLNAFFNSVDLHLKDLRQRVGEGICGKVVDKKIPILVKDINVDSRFRRNGFSHYRTNSFISIPLITSGGLLGLINLVDKSSGGPFSEKDLELASAVSKFACTIIDDFRGLGGINNEPPDKKKILLEKYASVGKLAAGVVHEINNPLDGIIRYTNILLEQIDSNSIAREYLLEVKKGLSRIANITRSLLEFSHQLNSKQSINYIDVHKVIDEALEIFSHRYHREIKVNKKYGSGLSRVIDFGLSHVISNLIKNALDAMPSGGTLEINTGIKDDTVEIIFKDTGIGIPYDLKSRIFEPFFTTKSADKGTGLGLSICNEIINKYEGSIEVQSLPGIGSTFVVSLPKKHLENG